MTALCVLICLGLQTKRIQDVTPQNFRSLSEKDWLLIKDIAERQAVAAIAFDGLEILIDGFGKTIIDGISPQRRSTYITEWIANRLSVEQDNQHQIQIMDQLSKKWNEAGCRVMIMKGYANSTMYPNPEHRTPGDIDCYLFDDYAKCNLIAGQFGAKVDESWYKHSTILYKGELFENHQFFVHTREGKRSKMLQKELEKALVGNLQLLTSYTLMPPVQWNAMFLTYHGCGHFLEEGLKLKHLLDWAMFLEKHQQEVDWEQFYDFCRRYHFKRYVDAITSLCKDYLGVKIQVPAINTISPFSEKVFNSILYDNDYIFGKEKGGWYNRLHIIKNLFRYRWKYEEIYQQSVWKQLWWYAYGFIFHTE